MPNNKMDNQPKPIELAVQSAAQFLFEGLKATNTSIKGLRLEEAAEDVNAGEWKITLSYIDASSPNSFAVLYGNDDSHRIYKTITVSVADGQYAPVAIKERTK